MTANTTRPPVRDRPPAVLAARIAAPPILRMPRSRPLLARPAEQIAVAIAASIAVAAAWYLIGKPAGGLVAFALVCVPLCSLPFELCLAFIILSHFRLPEVYPELVAFRLPQATAAAAMAAGLWHLWGTKRIKPSWSPELTLFLLFFIHASIGVVLATDRQVAFAFWSGYLVKVALITLAIAWLTAGPRQFARAAHAFVAAGLAVAAVVLWNEAHGIGLVEGTRVTIGRDIGSVLGDPNDLALVLLFPVSFAMGLASTRGIPVLSRLFGAGGIVVLLLAILATQSRGGMLGFAAVVAPFVQQRIRSVTVAVLLAAAAAALLYVAAGIGDREMVAGATEGLDESAMGRVLAWQAAINMALAHPLAGVGIGTFTENYFSYVEEWHGKVLAAHSVWFQVLAETGFVGLLLYVAMLGSTAGRLLRSVRRLRSWKGDAYAQATALALLGGLAGFVVAGSFLSKAYDWPAFILLGLSVALSRYAEADAAARSGHARA